MRKLLLITFLITGIVANAQYVANYKKIADTYFEHHQYYAAAEFYKKGLGITSDSSAYVLPYNSDPKSKVAKHEGSNQEMVYRLAESSRFYKNYLLAEKYYAIAKTFHGEAYAGAGYYNALCMHANGQIAEAAVAFQEYITTHQSGKFVNEAKKHLQLCEIALEEMKFPKSALIDKVALPNINTLGSNYSPVTRDGRLYFTSSRPTEGHGKVRVLGKSHHGHILKNPTEFVNHLYVASGDLSGKSVNVEAMGFAKEKGREYAALTFSPDGKHVFMTSWLTEDSLNGHRIYTSSFVEGKWTNPSMVVGQVNSNESSSQNPFVTSDGKYMIFSSNRTGGYGMLDLWYCPIRQDGSFGQAVNMGAGINSAGNEKTAYYNPKTGKFIYSSDGKDGFGGFDFFTSTGNLSTLTPSVNMGHPINSSKDDVYFMPTNDDDTEGYFSSDRASECCLEIFKIKHELISINGKIIDCKTKKPLKGVKVTLAERENKKYATTDDKGNYSLKVDSRRPLKLAFELENYFGMTKAYQSDQIAKADTLLYEEGCMTSFKVNEPILLDNIYFAYNSAELNLDSKNTLNTLIKILRDNADLSIELSAHTDSKGTDIYNLDLSQRRAESCVDYLVQNGIDRVKLTAKGYGESKPVAPNSLKNGKDNPDGRTKNRRTEFTVLGQNL